jgi:hypothetical protein
LTLGRFGFYCKLGQAVGMYGPTAAVTHIRTSSGQLKIILWTNLDEANIVRGIDRTAYPISDVVAANPYVTASQDDQGNLKISWWHVTAGGGPDGGIINNIGDASAGKISKVSIALLASVKNPPAGQKIDRVATAIRDSGGNLKIIIWHLISSSIS